MTDNEETNSDIENYPHFIYLKPWEYIIPEEYEELFDNQEEKNERNER